MWCPVCGDEFRPGFTRCQDCQVDLVEERPPPPPDDPDDPAEHEFVEYDLAELTDEQLKLLDLMLKGAEIPFVWEPLHRLVVGVAVADEVDEILDFVDESAEAPAPLAADDDAHAARPPPPLASPGRRVLGSLVDRVALTVVAIPLALAHAPGAILWTVALVYEVATIALWGRTLGKLVVDTRVVTVDDQPPGWRAAMIRALVPELATIVIMPLFWVATPSPWIGLIGLLLWPIVVYAPILGADRQGLHDQIAGTLVVRDQHVNAMMTA